MIYSNTDNAVWNETHGGSRVPVNDTGSFVLPTNFYVKADNTGYVQLANGNVGIGTSAPSEKLHVVGNILASGTITPSDRRLKSNIDPINNGLDSVMKMKPISYDKAWELGGEVMSSEYGFLANELKAIFTGDYIVKTPKQKDDILSVNYTSLIAVLTRAIQEQQVQINDLKSRLN